MNKEELLSKTNEEIIELCKEYKLNYLQKNGKKHYKKETLIKLIMSSKFKISKDINKPFIQNISNKEALKNKIHDLHNYLRNNGIGYGMNGLKVFNLLYGLKKIEENNLLEKLGLSDACKFSELLKLCDMCSAPDGGDINDFIINRIRKEILEELFCYGKKDQRLKNFLFYEIPDNIKATVLPHLIKEIDTITEIEQSCNVNLSGKIYEYFIGRDRTAISEMGAYFTDRHIVEYIYNNLLKPSVNKNGEIGTMIDMFGGSGGFTIGYINYLQENYKNINWKTEINKISHYDMNGDVVKAAALEFLCLTKELPDMGYNMKQTNSFTNEFYGRKNTPLKYKYIITNPPYGGDKNEESDTSNKNKKIKKYIEEELKSLKDEEIIKYRREQLKKIDAFDKFEKNDKDKKKVSLSNCSDRLREYAKDNKLSGNDKESCSLIQIMNLLEVEGTAIGVLKEGVFFDSKYRDLREVLIKKFNVRKVISVPSDQFENTTTKTSIIVFDNTEEKTSIVEFYDLVVNKFKEDRFEQENNTIILTECEGDIYEITDKLISVAMVNEILKNDIKSLNGKDYKLDTLKCNEGYELVKLGDIAELENGKQLDRKNIIYGEYPVYSGGLLPIGFHNSYNNENCTIIAGTGKCGFVQFDKNKFWASQSFTIKSKDNDILNKYLFIYCKSQEEYFMNSCKGSVQKFIRANQFQNLKIPIPKSQDKIKEWVDKISSPYNEKNNKQKQVEELEEFIKNKIKDIQENEDCDEVMLGDVCEYIKTGKNKTPDNKKGTLYPYYGTADITGYTNHYLFDGKFILVARNGTMGNSFLVKGKIYPSDHIFIIKNKDNINIIFIYYIIKLLSKDIEHNSNGSTIKGISKKNLSNLKIKIPKDEQIIKDLEPIFNEIEKLKEDIDNAGKLFDQYIKELREDAIKTF